MTSPAETLGRALRGAVRRVDPLCLLCQKEVRQDEGRLRLREETYVHSRCATYRMRNRRAGPSRLGYPG